MDKLMICLICEKELYSEAGKGCRLCGMPLDEKDKDFCCKDCIKKYNLINQRGEI